MLAQADARAQRRRPAPGVWSPLEYAGHCADVMTWYGGRIRRLLAEDAAQLQPFDWDTHTQHRSYRDIGTEEILSRLRRSCQDLTTLLSALGPEDWKHAGTGSDGTARTIADLTRRAAHEAVHHALDIRAGLEPA
jgi:DinB family protein